MKERNEDYKCIVTMKGTLGKTKPGPRLNSLLCLSASKPLAASKEENVSLSGLRALLSSLDCLVLGFKWKQEASLLPEPLLLGDFFFIFTSNPINTYFN